MKSKIAIFILVSSNRMAHVNGRSYGNLEGLVTHVSARSVFYFFSLNRGLTSVHVSGQVGALTFFVFIFIFIFILKISFIFILNLDI